MRMEKKKRLRSVGFIVGSRKKRLVEFNGGWLWRKWEVEGRRIRVGRDLWVEIVGMGEEFGILGVFILSGSQIK